MKNINLVMGIGNDILMDDGIGPKVVTYLEKHLPVAGVDYRTAAVGGMEILEFIVDYQDVIFIDAIKTVNGVPGTVYECTPASFKETLHLSSVHDMSFLAALEFGRALGFSIPGNIYIFAVEIIEDQVFGDDFTSPLQERFDSIVNEIQERLLEIFD